jgi:hypothetical protein
MGTYLSTPVTDKDTEEGEGGGYKYGASAMQGWRRSMEDEHIVLPSLRESGALAADAECVVPDAAMFAVFDGHGGKEVAKFCKKYMPGELAKSPDFREGNLEVALIKVYQGGFSPPPILAAPPFARSEDTRLGRAPLARKKTFAATAAGAPPLWPTRVLSLCCDRVPRAIITITCREQSIDESGGRCVIVATLPPR